MVQGGVGLMVRWCAVLLFGVCDGNGVRCAYRVWGSAEGYRGDAVLVGATAAAEVCTVAVGDAGPGEAWWRTFGWAGVGADWARLYARELAGASLRCTPWEDTGARLGPSPV